MKRILLPAAVLAGLAFLTGCQAPAEDPSLPFAGSSPGPAREPFLLSTGEKADLVIYFPSWEYIGILRPLVADGKFLRFMDREQAEEKLRSLSTRKQTAAVICDLSLPGKDRAMDMVNWTTILTRTGYKKIYFVRKEPTETLAQADILEEHPPREGARLKSGGVR